MDQLRLTCCLHVPELRRAPVRQYPIPHLQEIPENSSVPHEQKLKIRQEEPPQLISRAFVSASLWCFRSMAALPGLIGGTSLPVCRSPDQIVGRSLSCLHLRQSWLQPGGNGSVHLQNNPARVNQYCLKSRSAHLHRLQPNRTSPRAVVLSASGAKTVLVPVANGSEEIEAVTIVDVLRRAGAEVTVASVEESLQVEMSRQVRVVADKHISECAEETFDAIALPVSTRLASRPIGCSNMAMTIAVCMQIFLNSTCM